MTCVLCCMYAQASLSSVKLSNEVKAANKRAADMKADRDELASQLTQLRQEMGQMASEFSSVSHLCHIFNQGQTCVVIADRAHPVRENA